ncbi:hypothetical protein, conserved [Plasmodium gonderi]|uniref:Uncharacterized protein n=1 Tax=Plasmodium gonderi TaxID=77519 RepID=A0A1Y1JK21_PLAGO|nr:hypothetical protein, conserved [Plasmodium gonderi]GAW81755.1 hypothetical protein, conserved [Plasmodium gonderi]
MKDDEMNYAKENMKNKNDNKINYMHHILESKFDKKIKEKQDIYEINTDLTNYEDYISPQKKRAFTLGAIDGIGGISILNAPLINPESANIDPPILQLPSATNLIKNVHVKVHFDKNIDKSYKYRTQNSNKDVIKNMKPLYSLPEKVITHYMHDSVRRKAKNSGVQKGRGSCARSVETTGHDHIRKKDHHIEESCENIPCEQTNTEKNNPFEDKELSLDSNDKQYNSLSGGDDNIKRCDVSTIIEKVELCDNEKLKMFTKTKLVKKSEGINKFTNVTNISMGNNNTSLENANSTSVNMNYEKNSEENDKDQLNFFKLNQIMSSALTNTLRILADDVFV